MVGGLLERDREVVVLEESMARARLGNGGLILVSGPAGVGKSSLINAARAVAAGEGFGILQATGGELETGFPFGVVRQLLERLPPVPAHYQLRAAPAQRVFEGETAGDGDALSTNHPVLRGLYWMVAGAAEERPLAFLVDDAHWADLASLRFLDYLSRRLEDIPVVVVLACRENEPSAGEQVGMLLQSLSAAHRLQLQELSPGAATQLLSDRLGEKPAPAFAEAVYQLTGGNPLLLDALAAELKQQRIAPDASNLPRLHAVAPTSVAGRLSGRLHQLGDTSRQVAESAAVLGDGSALRLIAAVAGVEPAEAAVAADRLTEAEVFSVASPLRFRHPILRTALLEALPAGRRSNLHRRAASVLSAEGAQPAQVAAQLLHVEPVGDPSLAGLLREAGRESMARGSPDSAVVFLRRAVDELEISDPDRAAVLLELGTALSSIDPLAGAEVLCQAADTACSDVLRARAARRAGYALGTAGCVVEGLELVESHLRDLSYEGHPEVRALARMSGELHWTVGRSRIDSLRAAQRYWDWADGVAEEAAIVAGGRAYVECVTLGDLDKARSLAKAAADDERLLRGLQPGDFGVMATLAALVGTDQLLLARSLGRRLRSWAAESGEPTAVANCNMWSSWADTAYGDLVSAQADGETALAAAQATGQYLGVPVATLAMALVERGQSHRAAALFDEGAFQLDEPVHRQDTMTLIARAGVWLSVGRSAEAAADLDRLAEEEREIGDRNPLLGWRPLRAMALAASGRLGEARTVAADHVASARQWGAPRSVASALRVAARLEPIPAARLELLREAASVVEDSQSRLERAKVEVALGSELRRQGRQVEAREWLRRGYDRSSICAADGLAEFAMGELVAAGARPRRRHSVGVEALTPSERRVAEMAAAGMTNREIADALYISLKTVSFHLTSCYRKLGVTSREELGRVLERP